MNPGGLPVGFVKDGYKNMFGVTCAACHNGQVNYQGTRIIIDGGQGMGDFAALMKKLAAALTATLQDSAKFDRFATRILKGRHGADDRTYLHEELEKWSKIRSNYVGRQFPGELPGGYGRLDAIAGIFNVVLELTEVPGSRVPMTAPVSYNYVWDTPRMDWVQYTGDAKNAGIGSLERNIGELVGVFGHVNVTEPGWEESGYSSSIKVNNLVEIEETLKTLNSPQWPSIFPAIDQTRAARGKELYEENCASCHQVIDRDDPDRSIVVPWFRPERIGTDLTRMKIEIEPVAPTGVLEGRKLLFNDGPILGDTAPILAMLIHLTGGLDQNLVTPEIAQGVTATAPFPDSHQKTGDVDRPTDENPFADLTAYRARPLNGIWATPPYLTNGSVPNLYQLLLPPRQRDKKFYVRSKEFDPINVGYETKKVAGAFMFDTSLPGNRSIGHEFGTSLRDKERRELLEYLKTL